MPSSVVTGQRYEEFMTLRVLRPLGMWRAGLVLDQTTRARLATGYDTDGTTVIPYWHMIFPALGAIHATPREMAALVVLLINRGVYRGRRLLSAASVVRMESPRTTLAARSGLRYGYGLGNEQFSHAGFLFHGHGGDGDGYLSHFAYQTDLARGYFITISAFNRKALGAMKAAVLDHLVANQQPPKAGVAALPAETLATFTGTYRPVTWRFPWERRGGDREAGLEVVLLGGRLHLRYPSGRRRPLLPVTDRHFRFPDEPVATLAFVSADDELFLQGDIGNYRRTRGSPERSGGQTIGVGHQQADATPPH
jgi:CubicO group peptidase (beta-lactamase class C family)